LKPDHGLWGGVSASFGACLPNFPSLQFQLWNGREAQVRATGSFRHRNCRRNDWNELHLKG